MSMNRETISVAFQDGCYTAQSEPSGVRFTSEESAEEAVRTVMKIVRTHYPGVTFLLPYLGADFSMDWYEVRPPKPKVEDEFEDAQKTMEFAAQRDIK